MENIYPETLTLEKTGEGSTDFLESTITYTQADVSVRYFFKNQVTIQLQSAPKLIFLPFPTNFIFPTTETNQGNTYRSLPKTYLSLTRHDDSISFISRIDDGTSTSPIHTDYL